jgi:methionine aminopeptidase
MIFFWINYKKKIILKSYPPIYDVDNSIITQFEHTIFIKENGMINLTKNDFY